MSSSSLVENSSGKNLAKSPISMLANMTFSGLDLLQALFLIMIRWVY